MTVDLLLGLVAFTIGIGFVVFPWQVADAAANATGRETGRRTAVAIRAIGFGLAVFGFVLLL